jgi:hypothetical protein
MKDQILKIAKVKSEKEFYKKYPSEEAFMKAHGKAFKKAAMGSKMVNDQLHQLTDFGNPPIAQAGATTPKFEFTKPESFGKGAADAGMTALQNLDKIAGGISAIGEQKKAIKKADQQAQISGLALTAQQTMEKPKRDYVRPEDALVQPGQLGNPYGTGTNYLQAEDGAMIGGNPTQIQNTYANTGDVYQDLGYEPLEESVYKQYRRGGNMRKAEFGEYFQDSGQAQIGSAVGESIGSAFGPAGAAVGKFAGKLLGNALGGAKDARALQAQKDKTALAQSQMGFEQARSQGPLSANLKEGGWVSHDWQPQTFTKFGEYSAKDLLKPPHDADMLRSGGHLAQVGYTAPSAEALYTGRPDMPQAQLGLAMSPLNMLAAAGIDKIGRSRLKNMLQEAPQLLGAMEYGGQMAMGGELEVGDGGRLETMSYNPNLPGGEIGMFRGASHDNGGIKTKYGENEVEVEGGEPAVKLQDGGKEDNLVVFGNIKINNNIADLMGDPKAKGKKFKTYIADVAKNDAKQLKKIQKGLDLIDQYDGNSSYDRLGMNSGMANLIGGNAWQKINADKIKEAGVVQDAIHQTAKEYGVKSDMLAEGKLKPETDPSMMAKSGKKMKKAQVGIEALKGLSDEDLLDPEHPERMQILKDYSLNAADREMIKRGMSKPGFMGEGATDLKPVEVIGARSRFKGKQEAYVPMERKGPSLPAAPQLFAGNMPDIKMNKIKHKGKFDWKKAGEIGAAALSNLEPWLRPSNANEQLNPDQLMGEYYALANNQLDPVQAQKYQPMLDTPYDISLNDQINAIDSQSRAAIRAGGNNPAAQAIIMAQSLEAKNRVLGEQNRINQANKMQVYDRNRSMLNDAQLKNLQILDNQYVRQAQAKSNTKEQTIAALNSISAKTIQQRAANRKLAVMENLYNFRFDPSGRAYNVNGLQNFNMSGNPFNRSTMGQGSLEEGYEDLYNTSGRRVATRRMTKGDTPSSSDLDNFLNKNGGKTSKDKARNSSIVKALKNL